MVRATLKSGELAKNIAWHLDKDSSFSKEVVFEWGYARNFICGACGERDLQYRTDEVRGKHKMHCRCMPWVLGNKTDIAECLAIPLISE